MLKGTSHAPDEIEGACGLRLPIVLEFTLIRSR